MENAPAIVALGYPAVDPVLPELLRWLQDLHWPVARPIANFLDTIPEAIAPLIDDVLHGDDMIWKYCCIIRLISRMPPSVAERFRPELTRLAREPNQAERHEELNEVAEAALLELWPTSRAKTS